MITRRIVVASASLLVASGSSFAQTAISNLPQGNPVAGWAIEVITNRPNDNVEQLVDERGLASLSIPAGRIDVTPLAKQYSLAAKSAHNAKAFLRVDEAGPYTFGYLLNRRSPRNAACQFHLMVGGQKVASAIGDNVSSVAPPMRVTGNVRLQRGVYPIQYIHRCNSFGATSDESEIYQVQVRGPNDDALRDFAAGELFHVRR